MIAELIGAGTLGAAGAFGAYWYLKFRDVLPMESSLHASQKALADFTVFARETMERAFAPEQPEHYGDITSYYLEAPQVLPRQPILLLRRGWANGSVNYLKYSGRAQVYLL